MFEYGRKEDEGDSFRFAALEYVHQLSENYLLRPLGRELTELCFHRSVLFFDRLFKTFAITKFIFRNQKQFCYLAIIAFSMAFESIRTNNNQIQIPSVEEIYRSALDSELNRDEEIIELARDIEDLKQKILQPRVTCLDIFYYWFRSFDTFKNLDKKILQVVVVLLDSLIREEQITTDCKDMPPIVAAATTIAMLRFQMNVLKIPILDNDNYTKIWDKAFVSITKVNANDENFIKWCSKFKKINLKLDVLVQNAKLKRKAPEMSEDKDKTQMDQQSNQKDIEENRSLHLP